MDEQELIRKIGLLLKKAEGTDNEHEADAFYKGAQELMLRYAIDEEIIRVQQRAAGGNPFEGLTDEDYMFSTYAHHSNAKEVLFQVVAKSLSVKVFTYANRKNGNLYRGEANRGLKESQWIRVVGYKPDIEHTKILFLSLLIQSQRFAGEDWSRLYGKGKHSSDGLGKFTWITGHMEGFAQRVGELFRATTTEVYAEVDNSKALILDKETNIQEWMYETGKAVRPRQGPRLEYCMAAGFPPSFKAKKNSRPFKCLLTKGHAEGEHPTPHDYSWRAEYSSYSPKGRAESYEGRAAGRMAANRADLSGPSTSKLRG